MMRAAKFIATCFGIGYIQKGAGTVAALFCCLIWWFCRADALPVVLQLLIVAGLFLIGVWASSTVEKEWGHDSNRVVVDEVQGMSVALFLLPHQWQHFLAAFVLFRFFDIAKPLGIRKAEGLNAGWGVMGDDLLAGIYSALILQIAIKTGVLS